MLVLLSNLPIKMKKLRYVDLSFACKEDYLFKISQILECLDIKHV